MGDGNTGVGESVKCNEKYGFGQCGLTPNLFRVYDSRKKAIVGDVFTDEESAAAYADRLNKGTEPPTCSNS